eukprot:TRINITY_DN3941_c0_g3_i1.p1 TRINITY_DN3941_c0_g3~~TRINITY_DN3941_c0_g3_i1.p1  ORF type:complete len:131 (-),score=32.37 TRINITY_DN3941_c0_g3_i1:55-447(-)
MVGPSMAHRSRSSLATLVLATFVFLGLHEAFVPTAAAARDLAMQRQQQLEHSAAIGAVLSVAAVAPAPVLAARGEDDEEGFDVRIIIILAPAAVAVSWALFNVWRVLFRQTVRIGESASGSSKLGLGADD